MRIGLIAPPWLPVPPPRYGGTEGVIDRLARGLRAAGQEVVLFTTGDATCPVPRAWVLEASAPERLGEALVEQRHVVHAYAALEHCDIVHDHTTVGPFHAERYPGLPVVVTNHGPFTDEARDVYRAIALRAGVIAISHHQAAAAGDVPIAAVIHHGIDVPLTGPEAAVGDYLLFLGRMAPEKGAHLAAHAAREAGASLKIAARMRAPAEVEYFTTEVAPLLGGDIEFVGEVGGNEKLALLAGARALVNPIRWPEPFGLVMIEALAHGTPVLSLAEGAAPEIVTDGVTGWLCEDVAGLVAAIDRIDALDRGACRAAAVAHFSTELMVAAHLELYTRRCAARPAGTVIDLRSSATPSAG